MGALIFLLLAAALSVAGWVALWLRHRRPTTLESGIEAFQREMRALAPPDDPDASDRRDRG